eukprot:scaffold210705_cov27-Tisochrysis_lutea.AAC.1
MGEPGHGTQHCGGEAAIQVHAVEAEASGTPIHRPVHGAEQPNPAAHYVEQHRTHDGGIARDVALHGIAWHCMASHSIAWHYMASHSIAWHHMALHGVT